jgi:hypothetical protein
VIFPDRVIAALRVSDKPQLLRELSQRAANLLAIDTQRILDALQVREALGSTGVGQGIAVPHARIAGLHQFFRLFTRPERPIDFIAIDERPKSACTGSPSGLSSDDCAGTFNRDASGRRDCAGKLPPCGVLRSVSEASHYRHADVFGGKAGTSRSAVVCISGAYLPHPVAQLPERRLHAEVVRQFKRTKSFVLIDAERNNQGYPIFLTEFVINKGIYCRILIK